MKLRNLAALGLCVALGGSLAAQERLATKQLAGPIDEMKSGVMAKVNPIDAGIHSKSAMIPVTLTADKDGMWRWNGEVAVDGHNLKMAVFSGEDSWTVRLADPFAKSLSPAHVKASHVQRSNLEMGNNAFEADGYEFNKAQTGTWNVAIEADGPRHQKGFLLYGSDSPYRLLSYKSNTSQLVGQDLHFVVYGYNLADKVLAMQAQNGMVQEAWMQVTAPSGAADKVAMFDDGLHGDGAAGDGVFGGSFKAIEAGQYQVQTFGQGATPAGLPFMRTAQHIVPVVVPSLQLAQDVATASLVSESRLNIAVPVHSTADGPRYIVGTADGPRYRVFAEVWGADAEGKIAPVNWIGGMVYLENGQLNLGLDLGWIGLSQTFGDFELRNLRIEDPDTFITVAKADRLRIETPALPNKAFAMPKSISEEMLMGPRPAPVNADKAGRLLLVHGYCSGDAWGPVSNQFSNDSVFQDFNQNRSHDAFAQLIGNFGSAWSSFGVVAHSQGGAASLHLYTYYWSGLDNASSGRLIQSVGTPYQGTSLAGNIALLGDIFGVGCGANNDLTYSGASSWLSGIPSWARNKVNYYTTSFKDNWWSYDYCNFFSDLILSDPDDGTTERAKGQLSSGVNRGHKQGWCHTSGMADPPQVTDSSRNSTMNSNAAN